MKKLTPVLLSLFIAVTSYCQPKETSPKLNLDFENIQKGSFDGWKSFGGSDYILAADSSIVKNGKHAASIELKDGNAEFAAWDFTIPYSYVGKKITLSGYIKTDNVTNGYAGLWMRIDPDIAFDNMNKNGIKGTTDWTKYEITLDLNPQKTKRIVVGGLLAGKGKMWLDNLAITIDGKDIKDIAFEDKLLPAEKDNEFDKGSLVKNIPVNSSQIENLRDLGLIWGFLKYYHPNIAKGQYNWDYELFRILPGIIDSKTKAERDQKLTEWINHLGQFSVGKESQIKPSETKLAPDLDWITTSKFPADLVALLIEIKNANRPNENFYVDLLPGVRNPSFKNENAYSSFKYPDAGYRLLSLFRYWNIIQYYFPYKNLIEEDWKDVLKEFIPKVIDARNETDYTLTVLQLIARVNDTHANIWGGNQVLNNHFGLKYAPVEVTFIENKLVVTGYYDKKLATETGLKIGDVITAINNKPVEDILKERLKFSPASNYPTKLRDIAPNLLRSNDSIINIDVTTNEGVQRKKLKTFSTKEINIYSKYQVTDTCFKIINKDIAYLNNGSLKKKYLPAIWKDLKNTKGLIIDIRNYPSDFVIYALSNYLMPKSTHFVKFTNASLESPGLFTYTKPLHSGNRNNDYYKG